MGGTAAKFSVSALMFDYVLTSPISAVSAGLYLVGLLNQTADHFHYPKIPFPTPWAAALFAVAVTAYFWRTNTVGVPFRAARRYASCRSRPLVVILIGWCVLTIVQKGYQPVPAPARPTHHKPLCVFN
jgi:hypothetical protein